MYVPSPFAIRTCPVCNELRDDRRVPCPAGGGDAAGHVGGKDPRKIRRFHRCQPCNRRFSIASRRSYGIDIAPAIVLNRMYHCAPSAHQHDPAPVEADAGRDQDRGENGKRKFAGKLRDLHDRLREPREARFRIPIFTPTGTQISVETTTNTITRRKVTAPSPKACANSAKPVVARIPEGIDAPPRDNRETADAE